MHAEIGFKACILHWMWPFWNIHLWQTNISSITFKKIQLFENRTIFYKFMLDFVKLALKLPFTVYLFAQKKHQNQRFSSKNVHFSSRLDQWIRCFKEFWQLTICVVEVRRYRTQCSIGAHTTRANLFAVTQSPPLRVPPLLSIHSTRSTSKGDSVLF